MIPAIMLTADECIHQFLHEAHRLGIGVIWAKNGMEKLDAAYRAFPGAPGQIVLHKKDLTPSNEELCTLLSHEMVHVLHHWKGNLKALPPLGWPTTYSPKGRELPTIEKEAYTAQRRPRFVLESVRRLEPIPVK